MADSFPDSGGGVNMACSWFLLENMVVDGGTVGLYVGQGKNSEGAQRRATLRRWRKWFRMGAVGEKLEEESGVGRYGILEG